MNLSFKPTVARSVRVQRSARRVVVQAGKEQVGAAYAAALLDLAQSKNAVEAVHSDVDSLSAVLKADPSVANFLSNPVMDGEKKKDTIKKIASEASFSNFTTNFLLLLVDKQRIDAADDICAAFEDMYCQLTDTQVATVKSAVKLEQEQQFMIAKKLQELTGAKNIKLKPVIDETLIAGFVVEYGSSQIDLSVKGQLDRITAELSTAKLA
jgi:F-type H+-transporting ATPase subunit delta